MYSNAPAIPTYNPASSADQMHSVPTASQPYYNLPGQQMSVPPGAPVTTQMPGYGAGQPMGQPQYNVAPQGLVGAGGGGGYQPHTVPGGPAGYQTPAMHGQPPQMYLPTSTSSVPQQAPQPQPGAAEYQPYNMQGKCHCDPAA